MRNLLQHLCFMDWEWGLCMSPGLIWMVSLLLPDFLLLILTITQVEMAEASRRGRKIVLLYIALSAGTAIGTWVKYGFQYLSTGRPLSEV